MDNNQENKNDVIKEFPSEIKQFINEAVDNIINWRALSIELTGNPNQITRTRIGKKYEVLVDVLRDKIKEWKFVNRPIHLNVENKFNGIVPIQGMGFLWIYKNGENTYDPEVFRLLSYDIFEDKYRIKLGINGSEQKYTEIPGSQYPKHIEVKGKDTYEYVVKKYM